MKRAKAITKAKAKPPTNARRARALLFALAWLVRECDVFARAHADEHAPRSKRRRRRLHRRYLATAVPAGQRVGAGGARAPRASARRARSAPSAAAAAKGDGTTSTGGGDSREVGRW